MRILCCKKSIEGFVQSRRLRRSLHFVRIMPLLAIQIFLADDLAHRLLVDLALYPGDEVQISEGAGFESIALEMPDLFQELFELGL